jgi:hypothetical protein
VQVNEINDPPTLDVIEDPVAVAINSGIQNIPLSGISTGPFENQTLTITATSSNTDLIPTPVISYNSPGTTGSLQYTPVEGASGSSVITVTVTDDGPGTAPHINTFTRTFTVRVNNMADIMVREASVGRTFLAAGENTSVFARLRNIGSIPIAATKLRFYLSDDPDLENTDITLGEIDIYALTSGEIIEINNNITIPSNTAEGEYYIIFYADADNVLEEFDEDNNLVAVPITIGEEFANVFASTTFPEYYTVGTSEFIGITTIPNFLISKVELHFRGISQTDYEIEVLSGTGSTYNIPAPVTNKFDEIGMEYFFKVFPENKEPQTSDVAYTYLKYAGDGLAIPDLKNGTTVADYQIISLPLQLTNSSVQATLEDDLGQYNKTQWRFFNYKQENNVEYKEGFETVEPGNGYWLISRHEKGVDTGEGTTLKVTKSKPHVIKLKQGWNQIGNPYNFNLSWNDILVANGEPEGLGALKLYNENFVEGDILPKFRGGFVFSENEFDLKIPVYKESCINNGRLAKKNNVMDSENSWEVLFSIKDDDSNYILGGFGMNDNASFSKDKYDEMALPVFDFLNNISISFSHHEYFYPDFSKDIVPVTDGYTWEFSLHANDNSKEVKLEWEKLLSETNNQIILVDLNDGKKTDIKVNSNYTFNLNQQRNFKVVYGSESYINEQILSREILLGKAFPNPFTERILIPFEIPATLNKVEVTLQVYDITGRIITSLPKQEFTRGFKTITWDGTDSKGGRCKSGVYFFKLQISGDQITKDLKGRMILN